MTVGSVSEVAECYAKFRRGYPNIRKALPDAELFPERVNVSVLVGRAGLLGASPRRGNDTLLRQQPSDMA